MHKNWRVTILHISIDGTIQVKTRGNNRVIGCCAYMAVTMDAVKDCIVVSRRWRHNLQVGRGEIHTVYFEISKITTTTIWLLS